MDRTDIIQKQVQIKGEEIRQGVGASKPYDINISSGSRDLRSASEISLTYTNVTKIRSFTENRFIRF